MIKYIFVLLCFFFITLHFMQNVQSYSIGAPSGFSGAPGNFNNTCAGAGCHFGTTTEVYNNIIANIDTSGYLPGESYTINTFISHPDRNVFGFQMTAQTLDGQYLGTFLSNSHETQTTSNDRYITHTNLGIEVNDTIKEWDFQWIAPSGEPEENVTFFAAYNAADGDGTPNGDIIYTSSVTYNYKVVSNAPSLSKNLSKGTVFPNPAEDIFHITFDTTCDIAEFSFYTVEGRKLLTLRKNVLDNHKTTFSVGEIGLTTGRYIIKIVGCNKSISMPLIILSE
ncbi:MAG: T9SS C-terminal target domain-containing protein [Chitinophagaceae bacterium]|nr:MAG: T9SS C-terminal target domain-containing protein [Chitinophagaceae bacterium]